jgi:hypothetical protein
LDEYSQKDYLDFKRYDFSIYGIVPIGKSRNIPEVVIVRRGAGGVLGIWEGWVNWVKGGANGVSLQAT